MNLILGRNRNARIQQEPIIMSSSSSDSPHLRSSIPTSVEIKGRVPKSHVPPPSIILHEQHHKEGGQGSRPIPIKKCRPSLQEMEDEVNSADSASHYDWATWQMYTRIATARRLRAAAQYRSSSSSSSSISTSAGHQLSQQQFHHLIESGSMMHHDLLSQEQAEAPTTRDDNDVNDDGGVFAFDMS